MHHDLPLRLPPTDANAPCRARSRRRGLASHAAGLALLGVLALGAPAHAAATYSFQSGPLTADNANDTSSFTFELTTPAPLADGTYQWGTDNLGQPDLHMPAGVSFAFSDGYTTLTDPADLSPAFEFRIVHGTIDQTGGMLGLYAQDPSRYDAYYGYTTFYIGDGGVTQLLDAADPQIAGLDYAGHHIPVAQGTGGTWSYSFTSSVPEPADGSMALLGLGTLLMGLRRRRD